MNAVRRAAWAVCAATAIVAVAAAWLLSGCAPVAIGPRPECVDSQRDNDDGSTSWIVTCPSGTRVRVVRADFSSQR